MDKVSRKILNIMSDSGKGTSYLCSLSKLCHGDITVQELSERIGETLPDTFSAIDYLVNCGYLTYYSQSAKYGKTAVCLSHKGLHRRRISWDAFCKFAAQSVLTPIVVTLITEALLHGIPVLLKLIQQLQSGTS